MRTTAHWASAFGKHESRRTLPSENWPNAGRAPSYINDIEYNPRVPSATVLRDICQVLELDFDAMLAAAGRLGEKAARHLKREPVAGVLFRRVQAEGFRERELKALLGEVDRLVEEKRSEAPRDEGQP